MNLLETEKEKFSEKWWSLLNHHFSEQYIIDIYSKLREMNKQKHAILPNRDNIYKQFRDCKYDDVLVCFVVSKPIIQFIKCLVWQYMSMLIEYECYEGLNLNFEDNMDYLLPQGIIHIPVTMTFSRNSDHIHLGWQTFTKDCINHLSNSTNKILFIYEDSCMEMLEGIDFKKHQVELLEPGVFKKTNEFMLKQYNKKITW